MCVTSIAPRTARGAGEVLLHDERGTLVGQVRFRLCAPCRTGRLLGIWILESRRQEGLGRRAVRVALAQGHGYRWNTTLQTRPGRGFFLAVTAHDGVPLPRGRPLCPHLMGPLGKALRRLGLWRPGSCAEAPDERP
ncbi:GNAT family N-acetyltransferase [Streptomyces sp. NPDC048641]|uniref:GNAT family N-acetyltransferase n=1 Tax=Streptomyces sp. NPDC048641 TaxID=3154825 RepID=UPI0034247FAB